MCAYAKKRLGQNFLIDPNILRKIKSTIDPQPDEPIIEIGPGRGALTAQLLDAGARVHAIEIDPELIPELEEKFSNYNNFYLYQADALDFNFNQIFQSEQRVKYTGNVPYNITSPLLEIAYLNAANISGVYFLVQKEFAKRIAAKPGVKNYGILSVLSQYFGEPQLHFDVSPNVFRPVPKVTSAFFSIQFDDQALDYDFFKKLQYVVKMGFNKRRKTLRNSLKKILPENRDFCPIDLGKRPEELGLAAFTKLVRYIEKNRNFPCE